MTQPRVHLLYSDDRVKDRTDNVFKSMIHQLAQDDEDDHNTQLLKRALKYRQKEMPTGDDTKKAEVAACFGVKWHKVPSDDDDALDYCPPNFTPRHIHESFLNLRHKKSMSTQVASPRCISLVYSDELVKARTDSVFRSMLQQLSENDDDDHNTRLLKKALQYRRRPPHVNVTVADDTEVASCFGVRWQKMSP
ncbi:hypothetical protein SDRG_12295 [Saprolegnia diclina VS20]|uniref:Uncharacterized protein n=1 Tax=Saprolegnia diclina (strain VS20) TaxID=1156394 RepID=T0Q982_SAPDV|nr:hypothetical protein SDRG_12295 [Saprolegnia diclina VS20]EQC30015.1 hypothetical protein SDRG_12295 [Saprolegnia diclina VS20]|eukprot:XP_008616582.1 hypothetical protein SDRG_12295 [Saprolegnia diclina VS20]